MPASAAGPNGSDREEDREAEREEDRRTAGALDDEWARAAALEIWDRLASRDFAGWDPYDALNARFLPEAIKNARVCRRVLTQLVKRSPLPLQLLLGVKRQVDAYTLGHALLAAARLSGGPGAAAPGSRVGAPPETGASAPTGGAADRAAGLRTTCELIVARLRSLAQRDGDRLGWGYHFPVHTRFFSYVPPTPNLIVTAFVAKGMAAVTRAGLVDCTAEVRGAAAFILGGLPCISDDTGQCVGYVPGETAAVHNANLLAALVLCEAAEIVGATPGAAGPAGAPAGHPASPPGGPAAVFGDAAAWLAAALSCARYTVARQAADGSWPYSEEPYGRWVDGFHTGFVLEGLARVVRATGDPALTAALQRGVRYYVAQLFGPGGEPKYYPGHPYPCDALSAAQGIETLHAAVGGHAAQAVPGQLEWIRARLVRPGGRVAYQVHKRWTDRREFPRWASAPLMSALAGVGTGAATPAGGAPSVAAAAPAAPSKGGGS